MTSLIVDGAEVRRLLADFRRYLIKAWQYRPDWEYGCWQECTAQEEWLSAHWEILVEHPLRDRVGDELVLESYGDLDDESRATRPCMEATHAIYVNRDFYFHSFICVDEQSDTQLPKLDRVLGVPVAGEEWLDLPFDEAAFSLDLVRE